MFLPESVTLYGVEPVRVLVPELALEVRIILLNGVAELLGGQHVRLVGDVRSGHRPAVRQLRPHAARCGAPTLRLDDHDAVGAPGAVNRRGRRVLQYGHRLDVIGVQERKRVTPGRDPASDRQRHAVNNEQRLVARVHRRPTADPDRDPASGLTAVPLGDLDPGHLRLDQLFGADDAAGVELLGRHGLHDAGQITHPPLAVADRHQLLECEGRRNQSDLDGGRLARDHGDRLLHVLVTQADRAQRIGPGGNVGHNEAAV